MTAAAPVDLVFTAHAPTTGNRQTVGILRDNTVRATLAPLTIHFEQRTEAPIESATNAGFRILFETMVFNTTGVDWIGYRLELSDNSFTVIPEGFDDTAHPIEAHFHARGSASYFPFVAFAAPGSPSGCPRAVASDVSCSLLVSDGVNVVEAVGENNFLMIQNLLLHEREFNPSEMGAQSDPGRRFFDLVMTPIPVPEPGTLLLVGLGFLVLGGGRQRCRAAHRQQAGSSAETGAGMPGR